MLYLLHASTPIGGTGSNSAMHYLGYCQEGNLWTRMQAHHTGTSKVPIIEAFKSSGATLHLVRIYPDGGRGLERHLKNLGHYRKHCPVCLGWLDLAHSVNIAIASTLLPMLGGRRSEKPMLEALQRSLNGTNGLKAGPYTQLVIQAPSTWSGSVAGVSLAIPGGPDSRVVALMSGQAVKSAGTRLRSLGAGKRAESETSQESQAKRPTDQGGKQPETEQLSFRLTDQEGFET